MKTPLLFLGLAFAALLIGCGGDDDNDAAEETAESTEVTSTAIATEGPSDPGAGPQVGDQAALDEAIAEYLAANFPDEETYKGDCEASSQPLCGQFRSLDADGNEYIVIGDPESLESFGWVVVRQAGEGWEVVGHDLSTGWTRQDTPVIAPGDCQAVRALPGASGQVIDCIEPLTSVTIVGAPRLADGALYFPIAPDRWVLGTSLCNPEQDEGCGVTS